MCDLPVRARGRLVLWGHLAHAPFGGMTWQVLNHLVGLRRLGYDVWYVEDTDQRLLDLAVADWAPDPRENIAYLARYMAAIGMSDRWVFRTPGGRDCSGSLDWRGLMRLYEEADAVLNLCGSHELQPHHDAIRRLVYIETDPVANQVKVAHGSQDLLTELGRYSAIATYATNIDQPDCDIPQECLRWTPTVPPVVRSLWMTDRPPSDPAFTTVMNWSSPAREVSWQGRRWAWSKRSAFERVVSVPSLTSVPIGVAIRGAPDGVLDRLRSSHWRVTDAGALDRPGRYRRYIRSSAGEFAVAKAQYVEPRSGWISDRTVCFLAAGRPAVVQRTGVHGVPVGEGLLDFESPDEAAGALETVASAYQRHACAATELAHEFFDAEKVLGRMLERIGLR